MGFMGNRNRFNIDFKAPWLLQRCKQKGNYRPGQKISDWLSLDYMGSAEYEFGAVPATLREFRERVKQGPFTITEIFFPKAKFWLLSLPGQAEGFKAWFRQYETGKEPKLKERVEFKDIIDDLPKRSWESSRSDVWIDLDNCAAISTDPVAIGDFMSAVKASVEFMDKQKV